MIWEVLDFILVLAVTFGIVAFFKFSEVMLKRIEEAIDRVDAKLNFLIEEGDEMAGTMADLDAALSKAEASVKALVDRENTEEAAQAAEIASLQAEVTNLQSQLAAAQAAGSPDTQPLIDRIAALQATIDGLENTPAAPATPPAAPAQ